jgi:hypothetical protein
LLDGLEGVLAGQGGTFERAETERILSSLQKRTFFLHNVHDEAPVIFQTRWAMSYLRGPLTKEQIRLLVGPAQAGPYAKNEAPAAPAPAPAPVPSPVGPSPVGPGSSRAQASPQASAVSRSGPPVLPPRVEQFFVRPPAGATTLDYEPVLYAQASVRFADAKRAVDLSRQVRRLVPFGSGAVVVDWTSAEEADLAAEDLETAPAGPATFAALPAAAAKPASYAAWLRDFGRTLQQRESLTLLTDEITGLSSRPDESEAAFRARVQQASREVRDAEKEKLRQKYAPKAATLAERIRRAEQALSREHEQASESKLQTGFSIGATIVGVLLGRKTVGASTLGRATTAARGVGRSMRQGKDVTRAAENVESLKAQLADLEGDLQADLAGLEAGTASPTRAFTPLEIRPKKTHVTPERVVLVWQPRP